MLKSKNLLVLMFIVFVGNSSSAQIYVKGYYIALNGDTIKGTFLTDSYSKMSSAIRFKSPKGKILTLKPEEVQLVWMAPDRCFESKTIHFRNLSDELNGVFFLRRISKQDSFSLMKLEYDQHQGLYIQKNGEKIAQLQIFTDYFVDRKDDYRKKEMSHTDTLSHIDLVNVFGNRGDYKIRRAYLYTLRQFFNNNCGDRIVKRAYKLNDKDMIEAFHELSKCSGSKNKATDYFKESSWKPSVGITVGNQIGAKNFNYTSPLSMGVFFNFSDLRDGLGIGFNWLKAVPKATAKSPSNGSFTEYALFYNRKVFMRAKFNVAVIAGASLLKSHGLSVENTIKGTPYIYTTLPDEQHPYGILGISTSYQFVQNNYLSFRLQRNMFNFPPQTTYFNRVQCQYEYRF
jgi:hypothetical protein